MPEGKIQCGSSEAPAAVVVQDGTLYVFHQGWQFNGWLFYTSRKPDGSFEGDTGVPNTGLSYSPGLVLYHGDLYVFHHGRGNNGQLCYNKWDTWKTSDRNWAGDRVIAEKCISYSPRAVVYQEKIYLFYQGPNVDGTLRYRILEGLNIGSEQIAPNCKLSESPSPIVFNGKLVVFYQGKDDNQDKVLHWNEFDGSTWSGDQTHRAWAWAENNWISAPPCPVVVDDQIWLFHYSSRPGADSMTVYFSIMANDGNWDFYMGRSMGRVGWWNGSYRSRSQGPNVIMIGDTFYAFASGSDSWIYYKTHQGHGGETPYFPLSW